MERKRKVPAALAGLLALAACTGLARAQPAPTSTIAFPMIGIGFNQTLQVVVLHPPQPCMVTVTVYSEGGEVIVAFEQGDPDKPLQLDNVVSSFPHRAEVRPEVTVTPPVGVSPSACAAQATAEIFDNFTKTAWVVTPGLVPPGPPIMPIYLGPLGLTFEQTARLNVVAHPPSPCFGSIGFIDPSGNAIIEPVPVSLMAGQATFLDLTGLAAGTALGRERPEVIGVFVPSPTTAPGVCIPGVEGFSRITGYTRVFVPPGPQNMSARAP
jgi:hypothetical protein